MKTLSNKKGIALVILIIAMTLIAILGASFVSLMSSKQKGFLYQIDSYRALNIANAGVEYGIRYIGDNIDPTGTNLNDFFHSASMFVPVVSSEPDQSNLSDVSQWKKINFGNGSFYLSYYLTTSLPDGYTNNRILYCVGEAAGTKRVVKLTRFLAYASPSLAGLGRLNFIPGNISPNDNKPYKNGNYVVIPLLNIYADSIRIDSISLQVDFDNISTNNLNNILFSQTKSGIPGTGIYNYEIALSDCGDPPTYPCKDAGQGARIPDNTLIGPLDNSNQNMPGNSMRWVTLSFLQGGTSLNGTYLITFNLSIGDIVTLKFIIN